MNAIILGVIVFVFTLLSLVSNELGITRPVFALPSIADSPSGLVGILTSVIAPFLWVFNMIGAFVQLLTFQTTGIPVAANALIVTPLLVMLWYLIVKLIRQG